MNKENATVVRLIITTQENYKKLETTAKENNFILPNENYDMIRAANTMKGYNRINFKKFINNLSYTKLMRIMLLACSRIGILFIMKNTDEDNVTVELGADTDVFDIANFTRFMNYEPNIAKYDSIRQDTSALKHPIEEVDNKQLNQKTPINNTKTTATTSVETV